MTDGDLNATSGKWELEAVCVWRGAEHAFQSVMSRGLQQAQAFSSPPARCSALTAGHALQAATASPPRNAVV